MGNILNKTKNNKEKYLENIDNFLTFTFKRNQSEILLNRQTNYVLPKWSMF